VLHTSGNPDLQSFGDQVDVVLDGCCPQAVVSEREGYADAQLTVPVVFYLPGADQFAHLVHEFW
jgi:hypothetical protein